MAVERLLREWSACEEFQKIVHSLQGKGRPLIYGLEGSQKIFLLAGIINALDRPFLVVTSGQGRAEKTYEELLSYFPSEQVMLFPARDYFYNAEILGQSDELLEQRLSVLASLRSRRRIIVVAPVTAFLFRLMPATFWDGSLLPLVRGSRWERREILGRLVELGYQRAPLIEDKGQFSLRGEIIDVFPYNRDDPIRITLFDDLIESLRTFDPASQRSRSSLEEVIISPACEMILTADVKQKGLQSLRRELEEVTARFRQKKEKNAAARIKTRVENLISRLEHGGYFPGVEHFLSFFYPESTGLENYLPQDGVIVYDGLQSIEEAAASFLKELGEFQGSLLLQGELLPGQTLLSRNLEAETSLNYCSLAFNMFNQPFTFFPASDSFTVDSRSLPSFQGRWDLFQEELRRWYGQGYRIFFLAHSPSRGEKLLQHFRELEISAAPYSGREPQPRLLQVLTGSLENSFLLPQLKMGFLTEHELLSRKPRKRRLPPREKGLRLRNYQDLEHGDYVVHEHHGIGKYLGLRTLEVGGVNRDYLHIQYAGEDKLFIPVDQIEHIQKYLGIEGRSPRLNSLGGQEWDRIKSRVKASVQDLARELLALYAARQTVEGFPFSKDHPWQAEFEMRFPYEETPDQLQAIMEVKKDMEKRIPMDRLLCGDVGYGKTEVALRAAFKAVMDGKQVAVLVPTTVLAQQHYRTFTERFEGFPLRVDLLSRFRSTAAQKRTLKDLKQGKIDVLIGTHRLLSRDVIFSDLGLLIIDEEQRFGVKHKEILKQKRLEVDVLTMTATPIPRTLHLSLVGARDLSTIETPPEDRYPVQTYVIEYSDSLIREAISRELQRRGQVYFVYNRVKNIQQWALALQKMFPEARIAVAHGQMSERSLEKVMADFLEGEYDILVSTTIVEAGLDIPNVNTMIIYDADRFGLSQLYQLRGRVGRSNRIAYCYLTYRRDKVISEVAGKRLQAVKEFAELGSGFKIALRDLEIRGAGNLLGPEQHGFVFSVGFELYCQLLEEAIRTMKGEQKELREEETRVEMEVSAYIPANYIPNQQQKIDVYQRVAAFVQEEEVGQMEEELKDRFGLLPAAVENLLLVARIRLRAREMGITLIRQEKKEVLIKLPENPPFNREKLWQLATMYRGELRIQAGKSVILKLKIGSSSDDLLQRVARLLARIKKLGASGKVPVEKAEEK